MSHAAELLSELSGRGVSVTAGTEGRLLVAPADVLTDTDRDQIRANKPALLELLRRPPANDAKRKPVPMPFIKVDVRMLCGLDDAEISRMAQRVNVVRRAGYSLDDAEVIADRLLMRDRTGLGMHACLECSRLSARRCTARPIQSFDPRDLHELRHCPVFLPTRGA
ncbi:hypothetical protein [Sphaerotilus sp.]|uniref:TubC N-terminal docking domain-related protein n=1 Tax=Sphaerotilus sp. TaxID=2093942 RepID=UPI00286E8191|nr:hypothetical protein [Sphaerotilus sp.]